MRRLFTFAGILIAAGAPEPLWAAHAMQSLEGKLENVRAPIVGPPRSRQRIERLAPLDRPVTLAMDNVTLKQALDEVARQAGVRIAYSRRVVPLERRVSAHLDSVSVLIALGTLLRGTGVWPTIDAGGQILLVAHADVSFEQRTPMFQGSVSGTVRAAESALPVEGVTVSVAGTRFGALTRADGRYTITGVPVGTHRLQTRRLGYASVDTGIVVREDQQTVVDFRIQPVATQLEQVVTIGYGTTTRRDLTGAVASVTAEEFATKAAPTVTLSSGLQGKAAGVQVTSNTGMPGGGIRVRVRGTGSITANSEPLYVIDGLPAAQGSNSNNPQDNPLLSLDPNDVESIEILKDASATAIYGARGANGVVLITTKRGQRGITQTTIEASYGTQSISKKIGVLTGPQFMELANEAAINAGRTAPYTAGQIAAAETFNYPDMIIRAAPQASTALAFRGGDERARYLISGNYAKQNGIEIGSDFQRYGGRLNLDADVTRRLRTGTSLSLTRSLRNGPGVENGSLGNSANGIQAAMQFAPFLAPKDAAGNWNRQSTTSEPVPNPIATVNELTDRNIWNRVLGSAYGEYDIVPGLTARTLLGGNFEVYKINFFAPRTILAGGAGGVGWWFTRDRRDLTSENQLNYRRSSIGPGSLNLTGGFSVQTFRDEEVRADAANFPTDATTIYALGTGAQLVPPTSEIREAALLSYLGRAEYFITDRYIITVNGRYDGSSRFGANNKWAFFPSAAVAWRISEEPFMRNRRIANELKLRLGYGTVGREAIDPYQSLSRLNIQWYNFGAAEIPALAPSSNMANPDLRWEQQRQLNVGVDAAFWRNRVTLSLDGYKSRTDDLLLSVTVPSTTGYSTQLRNIGSVENRGLELSLSTVNFQSSRLSWRSSLNVAGNRNKVVDLGTTLNAQGQRVPLREIFVSARGIGVFFSPSETHIIRVDEPLGAFFGYRVLGLWQQGETCNITPASECTPGEYKIADICCGPNGEMIPDGRISAADRVILGQADPKFYGGLSNTVTYGPFSLDAFVNFVSGNKIINAGNAYGGLAIGQANERAAVLNRWTPQNTNTMVPRANNQRPRRLYSTLVEDGSYLRLQTLTFGYQLPSRLVPRAEAARLYVTAQNLFVSTNYSGFDPDVNSSGGDARIGGADVGAYPRTRIWNFGASITY
jgi:TonB-dependent starch-binding outer membrane protein SusC